MAYYDHYTGSTREWPYGVPRQPHPSEIPRSSIVVKNLKIEDPLEFRTNIPLESANDWDRLNDFSINKVDRTYKKHGLIAPREVKLEYGKRQIDIAVREQRSILDCDGTAHLQAKSAENVAWIPFVGDDRRKDILRDNADRLQRKYGVEDIKTPTFTRTVQTPPNPNSWGARFQKTLRKTGNMTDKAVDHFADLEDKSGLPTSSGGFVDQVISAAPILSKSGAFDAVDVASQVAQGVKSIKFPVRPMYKYMTAHDEMLETTDRQHELVRNRATAKHRRNLEKKVNSQSQGSDKGKARKKS